MALVACTQLENRKVMGSNFFASEYLKATVMEKKRKRVIKIGARNLNFKIPDKNRYIKIPTERYIRPPKDWVRTRFISPKTNKKAQNKTKKRVQVFFFDDFKR